MKVNVAIYLQNFPLTGLSLCRLRVTEAAESKTTDEEELLGSSDVGLLYESYEYYWLTKNLIGSIVVQNRARRGFQTDRGGEGR